MKLYFYNPDGEVIENVELRQDSQADPSRMVAADFLPKYEPRNGFYGKLFVEDGKLVWHFIPTDPDRELSGEEIVRLFEGVM